MPLHASARPAGAGSRGDGRRAGRHRRAVSAGGPLLSVHQSGSASGDDVGDGTGSPVVFGRPTRAGLDGGGMGKPPSGRLLPGTEIHGPGVRGPAERGGGVSSPPISSACGPPGGFQRPRSRVGRPQDRPPGRGAARVGGGNGVRHEEPPRGHDVPRVAGRVDHRPRLGEPRGRGDDVGLLGGGGVGDWLRPHVCHVG